MLENGYALGDKTIGITLPRRVGVVSVAHRVAQELNVNIGEEVGYSVKMNSQFNQGTLVKYMTDGSLIKEMLQDPLLSKYSVLMIDDVHERSINTDIIMGLLKKIKRKRPDLKLVVSSATLDARPLALFFEDKKYGLTSEVYTIKGRSFKVNINYLSHPVKNYVTYAAKLAKDIHTTKPLDGDILVFLTGIEEIEAFIEIFFQIVKIHDLRTCQVYQLHSRLPIEK